MESLMASAEVLQTGEGLLTQIWSFLFLILENKKGHICKIKRHSVLSDLCENFPVERKNPKLIPAKPTDRESARDYCFTNLELTLE